jgi:plastocyanin
VSYRGATNQTTFEFDARDALPSSKRVYIVRGASVKRGDAYSPNPIEIDVGDTVAWINDDSTAHTVTSGSGG